MPMTVAALSAALAPTIKAAMQAEFAAEATAAPEAFAAKLDRLSASLAVGIATGLVPYIQTQAQVADPGGTIIGKVL